MNFLENVACRFLIWRLKEGYGADCEVRDRESPPYSCVSCRAAEAIDFLKSHIELNKM